MQRHLHFQLLVAQLLMWPLLIPAVPVSSPELPNKSTNSVNSVQVQQLKALPGSGNGQDAHLNSLSVYASSYDSLGSAQAQAQPTADPGFKPSYKMPEMETNFTPMQTAGTPSVTSLPSTPMLMQYLPAQALQDGSGTVQYLQLIPTRPIIVPISPYLTAAGGGGLNNPPAAGALSPPTGAQPDYTARTTALLSALPANSGIGLHYGSLHNYASAISPAAAYRSSYRINREAKDKHFPAAFTLNLNEYLPAGAGGAGHDASAAGTVSHSHPHMYLRARS